MINKTQFINDVKTAYINKLEDLFISKYSFTGDDTFDINAQTLFFRTIFREGHVAVINILQNKKSIQRYYPNISKNKGIGNNGVVESAYIYPAWRNFTGNHNSFANYVNNSNGEGLQTQNVNDNKIVFFQNFNGEDITNYRSLKQMLEPFIEEIARRHLQASLYNVIAGGKITSSSSMAINNQIENNLYSVGENIKIDGSYENNSATFNVAEEVEENIAVIPFTMDPNIFLDGISKYETNVYKIFGIRTNQMFKKERMITGEVANDDHEFNAADFRLKQAYKHFTDKYKEMFNVDLQLVDNLADTDKKDKDKENKDIKTPDSENTNIESGGDGNE